VVGSGLFGGTGNQLWVADTNALTVFDAQGKRLDSIAVPGGPHYLCSPAGSTIYVTTRRGTVEAVDLQSHHLLPTLLPAGTFGPMDYDATTGEVYVPDQQHNLIDVLAPVSAGAPASHEPIRAMHFTAAPQSIAITSDGQFGFVALSDGTVSMLDIPAHQVVTTIAVGGSPHFIITGLYPSAFSYTPQQSILVNNVGNILEYSAGVVIVLVTGIVLWRQRRRTPKPER
jgi:DNA-binding beta-propeller fold protein YncE